MQAHHSLQPSQPGQGRYYPYSSSSIDFFQDTDSLRSRGSSQHAFQECSIADFGNSFEQQQQQQTYPVVQQYASSNEIYKPQERNQHGHLQSASIPYFRAPSVSQISMNTTYTTDYDTRIPSEPYLIDEFYSPSLPNFGTHYGQPLSVQQQMTVHPIVSTTSPQLGLVQKFQQQFTQQQAQSEIDFSHTVSASPAVQKSSLVQVKIESKPQTKINNRIIEDEEEDEENDQNEAKQISPNQKNHNNGQQQKHENPFEKYQQQMEVKHENISNHSHEHHSQDGLSAQSMQSQHSLHKRDDISSFKDPSSSASINGKQKPIKKQYKPKKKYQQSRQKNVFKNFGNALLNCIQNNFMIRDYIEKRLSSNQTLIQAFHNVFLLGNLNNLKNKEDFLQGWREQQPQDTEEFVLFRDIFRQISMTFFSDYAEKYVLESEKLKNKDIHIRAIPLFRKGIMNISELYTFKLS